MFIKVGDKMRFFNKDYIYLVWQNPKTRSKTVVGLLKRNGKFEFKYTNAAKQAQKEGFKLLLAFPKIDKKYTNENMFPVFSSRIPSKNRVDIDEILKRYNMAEYNEFELLKRSGAKTPLDTLEFIDPIVNLKEPNLVRDFFIAGTRYHCIREYHNDINIGDEVILYPDEKNEFDRYAIKMLIKDKFVGFVPKYYSKEISLFLKQKRKYSCKIINKNNNYDNCDECIRVRLILNCVN